MEINYIQDTTDNLRKIFLDSIYFNFKDQVASSMNEFNLDFSESKDGISLLRPFLEKMYIKDKINWVICNHPEKEFFDKINTFISNIPKKLENSIVSIEYTIPEIRNAEEILMNYFVSILTQERKNHPLN